MRPIYRLLLLCLVPILLAGVTTGCGPSEETQAPGTVDEEAMPSGEEGVVEPGEGGEEMAGVPAECADNPDFRACAVIEPGETITEATHRLTGHEEYLRVECVDAQGRSAWTNPPAVVIRSGLTPFLSWSMASSPLAAVST